MRVRGTWVLTAVIAGALLGGCGSSDDTDTGTSAAPAATSTQQSSRPAPSGNPVRVGFVNTDSGPAGLPEGSAGAKAAAKYVNERLGGVGGRPLELVACPLDGTVEKGIDCANQLVEDDVVAVLQGFDAFSADAMLPILRSAKLPLVGAQASTPKVAVSPDFYALGPPNEAYLIGLMKWYGEQQVKSATLLLPDSPVFRALAKSALVPAAEKYGVDAKVLYFNMASPDWTVLATAAMDGNPDAIGLPAAIDSYCTGLINALKSTGYTGRIFAAGCSEYRRELGAKAAGVEGYATLWQPEDTTSPPAAKRQELADYKTAMTAAGQADKIDSRALDPFAATVDLARIMGTIKGRIDGPSVTRALRTTADFDSFVGPLLTCDHQVWPGRSSCSDSLLIYRTEDDGTPTVVSDGFMRLGDAASLLAG